MPTNRRGRPPASSGPTARERLIAAARRLFARQGYDGTSVHDIAAEAGVADSALYGHFSGKEAMYELLLSEGGPQVVVEAVDSVDPREIDDPRAFLRGVLERVFEAWSSSQARTFVSIFTRDVLDGKAAARGIFSDISDAQDALAALILTWQRSGAITSSVDAHQVVWELFAPLVHIRFVYVQARSTRADLARGKKAARDHIDYALTLLFGK